MIIMKKFLAIVLAALLMLCCLTGCGEKGKTLAEVKKAGVITMATSPDFPPFENLDGTEVVGIEIDVMKLVAKELGVEILYYPFNRQRGAYKVIMRNRFMFIKDNLHPVMEKIVLLHELGHDSLHREEATQVGGFKEFNIFDMRDNRMEFEANVFASQIALPDGV